MLVIKSKSDLLEYYRARLKMAQNQQNVNKCGSKHFSIGSGMIYAYEECIKALEALIVYEKLPPEIQQPLEKILVSSAQALRENVEDYLRNPGNKPR